MTKSDTNAIDTHSITQLNKSAKSNLNSQTKELSAAKTKNSNAVGSDKGPLSHQSETQTQSKVDNEVVSSKKQRRAEKRKVSSSEPEIEMKSEIKQEIVDSDTGVHIVVITLFWYYYVLSIKITRDYERLVIDHATGGR